MNLLSQETASFGVLNGSLFAVSQKAQDRVFQKWLGVFGDTQTTFIVTATFPADLDKELSVILKKTVASAKVIAELSNPAEALIFEITPAADLSISKIIGNNMVLTRSGEFPVKKLTDGPLMVIAASFSQGPSVQQHREFALARLNQTAGLSSISAGTPKEIKMDGLPGYEIVGHALDAASGEKAVIYQVMLFEETGYYLMQGIIAERDMEKYLPVFKKTAESFKRKTRPK
jgi:hypothetical protein